MWWKQKRSEYEKSKGEKNRKAFKKIVESRKEPGILAYFDGKPIAWCALEAREAYPVLDRSRVLKRIDDQDVWSITCFYVLKPYRKRGITVRLINAAVKFARQKGATILESYPLDTGTHPMPDAFAWTGFASAFREAGFQEVVRRSKTRPVMRYFLR